MILQKKIMILFAVLGLSATAFSQNFPTEMIMNNGPSDKMIDLVFLSDGYQASEMTLFIQNVNTITTKIFNQTPFKEYRNYFNVIAVKVPSNQSGASHPKTAPDCGSVPVSVVDNYFGSSFDVSNIHRLLVPASSSKVGSVLAASYPQYNQVFILVNSPIYGGSGGQFATSSTEANAAEISIHEIGHSFVGLADEYWAGASYAFERPNLTQQSNSSLVKWKNWIGTNAIGVYPHTESPTWYRPHQNCKMRFLNVPFCSVCVENFVERIQNLTNPIASYSPMGSFTMTSTVSFTLSLILPEPSTLKITWTLNGKVIATDLNTVSVSQSAFTQFQNEVKAEVLDNTGLSRIDNKAVTHLRVISWTVNNPNGTNPVTGLEVTSSEAHYKLEAFPNPVDDKLHINYDLSQAASVRLTFTDMLGRTLSEVIDERQESGNHSYDLNTDNLNLRSSELYIMRLEIDGAVITRKIVRR